MEISVGDDLIAIGIRRQAHACAVALAIKARLGAHTCCVSSIGASVWITGHQMREFRFDKSVSKWLDDFDKFGPDAVGPITFELIEVEV